MSIFERIQRIAKANVNWLLDKAEPPSRNWPPRSRNRRELLEGRESAATQATFRRLETEMQQLRKTGRPDRGQGRQAGTTARRRSVEKVRLAERIAQMTGLDAAGRPSRCCVTT